MDMTFEYLVETCWTRFLGGIACASVTPSILCGQRRVTRIWAVNVYDNWHGIEANIVC